MSAKPPRGMKSLQKRLLNAERMMTIAVQDRNAFGQHNFELQKEIERLINLLNQKPNTCKHCGIDMNKEKCHMPSSLGGCGVLEVCIKEPRP